MDRPPSPQVLVPQEFQTHRGEAVNRCQLVYNDGIIVTCSDDKTVGFWVILIDTSFPVEVCLCRRTLKMETVFTDWLEVTPTTSETWISTRDSISK